MACSGAEWDLAGLHPWLHCPPYNFFVHFALVTLRIIWNFHHCWFCVPAQSSQQWEGRESSTRRGPVRPDEEESASKRQEKGTKERDQRKDQGRLHLPNLGRVGGIQIAFHDFLSFPGFRQCFYSETAFPVISETENWNFAEQFLIRGEPRGDSEVKIRNPKDQRFFHQASF